MKFGPHQIDLITVFGLPVPEAPLVLGTPTEIVLSTVGVNLILWCGSREVPLHVLAVLLAFIRGGRHQA